MEQDILTLIDSVIYSDVIFLEPVSVGSHVRLTIIVDTVTLHQMLYNLMSLKLISISESKESTIKCQRSILHAVWELSIDDCHVSIISTALSIQMKHENKIRIMGSLMTGIKLNGQYNHGFITCYPTNIDCFINSLLECNSFSSTNIVPIDSAIPLNLLNKVEISTDESAYVTTTLTLPEKQVSAVIGPKGNTLNSIRYQSKCWIKVFPIANSMINPTRHTLQQIQITGARENMSIAIFEIKRICGTFIQKMR